MRIVLHDYSGHPFQAQLSRELARRGHEVRHLYSLDFQTPKGRLQGQADDPPGLTMEGVTLGERFQKDSFLKRRAQEVRFGRMVGRRIEQLRPDVVLSSNAPLDAQRGIVRASRRAGAAFVFWMQDIYSEAISRILTKQLGLAGRAVGAWYKQVEYGLLRGSARVVAISDDFTPILVAHGVTEERIAVVENWAPLDEIAYCGPRAAPAPGARLVFVYSGTLGYKHNPEILEQLADRLPIELRVYSEGRAADDLAVRARAKGLANLSVQPWVAYNELSGMLGAADVLLAMIEADAGVFSVPSKVLTYLCAGRPILASIPPGNLAARLLHREGAGLVVSPGDGAALLAGAGALVDDLALRSRLGEAGRAYAERAFDIKGLGDQFEAILAGARTTVKP